MEEIAIVIKYSKYFHLDEELRREEFNKSRGMAVDKKPGTKKGSGNIFLV